MIRQKLESSRLEKLTGIVDEFSRYAVIRFGYAERTFDKSRRCQILIPECNPSPDIVLSVISSSDIGFYALVYGNIATDQKYFVFL